MGAVRWNFDILQRSSAAVCARIQHYDEAIYSHRFFGLLDEKVAVQSQPETQPRHRNQFKLDFQQRTTILTVKNVFLLI